MTKKPDKFEIQKNLYVIDSSGSSDDAEAVTRQVDAIFEVVESTFDASKIRRPKRAESVEEQAAASA